MVRIKQKLKGGSHGLGYKETAKEIVGKIWAVYPTVLLY